MSLKKVDHTCNWAFYVKADDVTEINHPSLGVPQLNLFYANTYMIQEASIIASFHTTLLKVFSVSNISSHNFSTVSPTLNLPVLLFPDLPSTYIRCLAQDGLSLVSCLLWVLWFKCTYLKSQSTYERNFKSTYERNHAAFLGLSQLTQNDCFQLIYLSSHFIILCFSAE